MAIITLPNKRLVKSLILLTFDSMPIQKVDREQIIKDSLKVFKTLGYSKTSMADIAKSCGLLKGSLYHYFKSKEDLMIAVLDYLNQYYREKVFKVVENELSGEEKLKFIIDKSEEIFLSDNGGCFMTSIGLETVNVFPAFTKSIKHFFNNWLECIKSIFEERHAPKLAEEYAEEVIAQVEGSVILMQLKQDKSYLNRAHLRILKLYNS